LYSNRRRRTSFVAARLAAGAYHVGPPPAELQGYVEFAVGVLAVSKQRDAGQALVKSPEAAPLIRKSGMEPRRTDGDLSSSMARNQDRSHTLEGGWGLSHVRPVPVGSLT
jgi:hypothetical protein